MESGSLLCTSQQLNLDVVLANGQSFRWKKVSESVFIGVAQHVVWKLWRKDDYTIKYKTMARFKVTDTVKAYDILTNYFQLNVNVENLYRTWSQQDEHFRKQLDTSPELLRGIRILRQDLVETLFAFICSANNNISRISGLVEKLCRFYGTKTLTSDDNDDQREFYDFPSLDQLRDGLPGMEERLRDAGFGYRAKYIADTVRKLDDELGGLAWLEALRDKSYSEARADLMVLPGVGPKVADCICLMALQKNHVVPVDTHVFQITVEHYSANVDMLKGHKGKKTLTKGAHEEIGVFYAERFGPYAGWAHSVLFSNRLRHLKSSATVKRRREERSI